MGIQQPSLFLRGVGNTPAFRSFDRFLGMKLVQSNAHCRVVHGTVVDPQSFFGDLPKSKDSACEIGTYVLKVYNKNVLVTDNRLALVLNEARRLTEVDSPFIVRLAWQFQTANSLCIVMEAVEHGDLFHLLYHEPQEALFGGGMPFEVACFFTASVLLALRHLHGMGIVFRNLKLENVLVDRQGQVKISSLGLAKRIPYWEGGILCTKTYTMCGTAGGLVGVEPHPFYTYSVLMLVVFCIPSFRACLQNIWPPNRC